MPQRCFSRDALYLVWTLQEKLAWLDDDQASSFVEKETAAVAKGCKDGTPSHLEYQKAYKAQRENNELTDRQKQVLADSVQGAVEERAAAPLEEFEKAHQVID